MTYTHPQIDSGLTSLGVKLRYEGEERTNATATACSRITLFLSCWLLHRRRLCRKYNIRNKNNLQLRFK